MDTPHFLGICGAEGRILAESCKTQKRKIFIIDLYMLPQKLDTSIMLNFEILKGVVVEFLVVLFVLGLCGVFFPTFSTTVPILLLNHRFICIHQLKFLSLNSFKHGGTPSTHSKTFELKNVFECDYQTMMGLYLNSLKNCKISNSLIVFGA